MIDNSKTKTNHILWFYTLIYLYIPIIIFFIYWTNIFVAIIGVVFILYTFYSIYCENFDIFPNITKIFWNYKYFLISAISLFIWLSFSGIGRIGFQNSDYAINNAMFKELIELPWPIYYDYLNKYLVYYTAFFLPASLFGKIFGFAGANLFIFVWAFLGLFLSFSWYIEIFKEKINNIYLLIIVLCSFIFFSGHDYLGHLFFSKKVPVMGEHLEWWTYYLPNFNGFWLQFSSQTTLLYWVPQQAIGMWIMSGIILYSIINNNSVKYLGFSLCPAILWSPLGFLGLFLFFIYKLVIYYNNSQDKKYILIHHIMSKYNIFISLYIFIILALYVLSNEFRFEKKINYQITFTVIKEFGYFILLEVGIYFIIGLFAITKIAKNYSSLFIFSFISLCLLTLYRLGPANDFAMRASIPMLFIFSSLFIYIILAYINIKSNLKNIALIVLFVGFLNSFSEIYRSFLLYNIKFNDNSDIPFLQDTDGLTIRVGKADSLFFKYLSKSLP